MANTLMRPSRSDRGAILIQTAITLGVMMALSAFVIDMGVLWMARRQAQNAADAAALAAGTSLMYDSYIDRTSTGPAHAAGVAAAQLNKVFGQAPQVQVDQSVDPTGWSPAPPPDCLPALARGSCAQASVFRDVTHSNPVPTYIAGFLSQPTENVRATATVQLRGGNANDCVKPWIAPDKSDTTTYTLNDIGTLLVLRANSGPSSYRQADFNGSGGNCPHGGGACYADAIAGCVGKNPDGTFGTDDVILEKPGNMTGPNNEGDAVWAQDPGATWDPVTKTVQNSCAKTLSCTCANAQGNGCANGLNGIISPRVLAIALFRPTDIAAMASPGPQSAQIKNIAGVFFLKPGTGPDPICVADPNNFCG
jgi:hypothetical protein